MALHERARGAVLRDPVFDFMTEMANEALNWPGRRIAKRANGVTFNLLRDVEQLVDIIVMRFAFDHLLEHAPHPAGALPAWRALTAAFMLIEISDPRDGLDQVGRLIHDDHRRGSQEAQPTGICEILELEVSSLSTHWSFTFDKCSLAEVEV